MTLADAARRDPARDRALVNPPQLTCGSAPAPASGAVKPQNSEDSMNRWRGFVRRAPGILAGSRGAAVALGLLALGTGACESNVTEPVSFHAVLCAPAPELLVGINRQAFAFSALQAAFLQAAGPIASAIGSSEQVDQIRLSLDQMPLLDDPKSKDTACPARCPPPHPPPPGLRPRRGRRGRRGA